MFEILILDADILEARDVLSITEGFFTKNTLHSVPHGGNLILGGQQGGSVGGGGEMGGQQGGSVGSGGDLGGQQGGSVGGGGDLDALCGEEQVPRGGVVADHQRTVDGEVGGRRIGSHAPRAGGLLQQNKSPLTKVTQEAVTEKRKAFISYLAIFFLKRIISINLK